MAQHKDAVIVTGSTGFIGSALINKFADQFRLMKRPPVWRCASH